MFEHSTRLLWVGSASLRVGYPSRYRRRFAGAIAALCVSLLAASASAQVSTWTGAVNDSWFNAGNWDNGLPNSAAFTAVVGAPSPTDFTGSITLGSLSVLSGGILNVSDSDNFNFDGAGSINNAGQINIDFNSDFQIFSTVTNNGTITVLGAGTASDLEMKSATTLAGSGTVFLNGANARIMDTDSVATLLTNGPSHTIHGNGNIGFNSIAILNNGLIKADVAGQTMIVDPATVDGLTNNGILRAEGGGILRLNGGDYNNTNGTIVSAGGQVQLSGASITGGLITGADVALPEGSSTSTFADLTTDATIQVGSNLTLDVEGTITNNGTITVQGLGAATDLELQGATTFAGSGTIFLNGSNARILDTAAGATLLTNGAGHTIRGNGNIGANVIGIANNGLIVADGNNQILRVDPAGASTLINSGILRAENNASLVLLQGDYDNRGTMQAVSAGIVIRGTVDSFHGTIEAVGLTGAVYVDNPESHTFQYGSLRVIDGTLWLRDDAPRDDDPTADYDTPANYQGHVWEFTGAADTDIFSNTFHGGPQTIPNLQGIGGSLPGDFKSDVFHDNAGTFRIGDGLNFTTSVNVLSQVTNSGTIVAGAGSTFAMGGYRTSSINQTNQIDSYLPLVSTGTLAGSGLIKNSHTGTPTVFGGGATIVDTDDIISDGFIKPGDYAGETGTLTMQAQDIYLGDNNVIEIELGSGGFDSLTLLTDTNPVDLNGGLSVSLLPTSTPQTGDLFTILTAANGFAGTFDTVSLPTFGGLLSWQVNYNPTSVVLQVAGSDLLPGDFNRDGAVNAADYTVWRDGLGSGFVAADYQVWRDNYGATSPSTSQSIPEPSAALLALLAACARGRQRAG